MERKICLDLDLCWWLPIMLAILTPPLSWAVGIFLGGTRTPDGRIPAPKLGAALIAAKAQVPMVPVSLWGTHRILPRGAKVPRSLPVTVRIGQPIAPPGSSKDKAALQAVTEYCCDRIHTLHNLGR